MQSSNPDVYAVGDVAAFPLKLTGQVTRQEHVVNCRQTAAHAMRELLQPNSQDEYDYLPYFYSRVFNLSWQFYGLNTGRAVLFSDGKAGGKFGTFWVDNGKVVGAFLESGTPGAMLTHPHYAFCACMALCPGCNQHMHMPPSTLVPLGLLCRGVCRDQEGGTTAATSTCRSGDTGPGMGIQVVRTWCQPWCHC